jgi:DNA-binding transcriptional LysR family regulator
MQLNDIDLNKLSTFFTVMEAGGISRAARRLGRTPSAVSQSVSLLEASLGCQLFDRVGRELVPTRGGQLLRARLAESQALLAETLGELKGGGSSVYGIIRLGLFLGFPRVRSRQLLLAFAERFPAARVRVVYAPQRDLEARLRKNELDYVLSFAPRSATATSLVSTRLFAQQLVLVTSSRFFRGGFSLPELEQTPVVDYYQSDPLIERWLGHHFPKQRCQPTVRFWAATTDLVQELVQAGAGVGVLPSHMLPALGKRGSPRSELHEVGPSPPLVDHVWLHEPRQAFRDATQRAFRDVLLSVLAAVEPPPPAPRTRPRRRPAR